MQEYREEERDLKEQQKERDGVDEKGEGVK